MPALPNPRVAVAVDDLTKHYGSVRALDGVSLEVAPGEIFGLLGPNGAGKSTTMRMLTGQAIADEGELRVLGYELPRQSKEARIRMGVVPQLDNLDIDVTVQDNLAVFARPVRIRIMVDLPALLGPSRPKISPGATDRLTPSSARTAP